MHDNPRPDPVRSERLDGLARNGIRHGFFTRAGGVSQGIYQGLNVGIGSGDDRDAVMENRRRVTVWLGVGPEALATPHQVHSPDVAVAPAGFGADRPMADAVVTDRAGVAIGVLTADCGPVLFADPQARVIGAAHAGWKGALGGVLENTIAGMERLGASRGRIVAVLGPSISGANYEVGPEFVARFVSADPGSRRFFTASKRDGHAMFDLPSYTLGRLAAAGVEAHDLGICTYAREDLFYSFRRTTHRGEPDYGRQISSIVLEAR